jgi:hypothetical protein
MEDRGFWRKLMPLDALILSLFVCCVFTLFATILA